MNIYTERVKKQVEVIYTFSLLKKKKINIEKTICTHVEYTTHYIRIFIVHTISKEVEI